MPREAIYQPSRIEFDTSLGNELTRGSHAPPAIAGETLDHAAVHKSPFVDYVRMLTPEGGILILYKDRRLGWKWTLLRVTGWIALTAIDMWILRPDQPNTTNQTLWLLVAGAALNLFLVTRKIKKSHSVEIQHDRMVLDGKHVFWAEDIGTNFPQLEIKDEENPDRMVIAGTCGTRHVEYMTCNRYDKQDRTPEVLASDLQNAMQQLWARRELSFDS